VLATTVSAADQSSSTVWPTQTVIMAHKLRARPVEFVLRLRMSLDYQMRRVSYNPNSSLGMRLVNESRSIIRDDTSERSRKRSAVYIMATTRQRSAIKTAYNKNGRRPFYTRRTHRSIEKQAPVSGIAHITDWSAAPFAFQGQTCQDQCHRWWPANQSIGY
jgi:hypothetical protein